MFNFLKPKKHRTLSDIDSLSLEDASKLFGNLAPAPMNNDMPKPITICRICQGDLVVVIPETKMEELTLKECSGCHERFYVL
jgi:hypothetical protein